MSTVQDEADTGPEYSTRDGRISPHDDGDMAQQNDTASANPAIHEILETVLQEQSNLKPTTRFSAGYKPSDNQQADDEGHSVSGNELEKQEVHETERPSLDGSSIPDDTASIQDSSTLHLEPKSLPVGKRRSTASSLRPFDRRFSARLSSSPLASPRAGSPAIWNPHSRTPSLASQSMKNDIDVEVPLAPWEVIRWVKLKRISGHSFSEVGKRNFGRPTCMAVSTSIALGTTRGTILIFDYQQSLKAIIGAETKSVESGAVTSVAFSADTSTVAAGHASGDIFTWEIARPAKPFLHMPSTTTEQRQTLRSDGHMNDAAVLHLGFLGTRNTALVSADVKGMAFSHLATRGLGAIARTVKTTRILGRYPENIPNDGGRPKKPSTVLAFSSLPLANMDHGTDQMGLVAMLTPYLLVIVSTTPIAQTQHKVSRPKEIVAHGAMTGSLAWYPGMSSSSSMEESTTKLAYCWSNFLTILDLTESASSEADEQEKRPELHFRVRKRWKAEESIVAIQWIGRSVLAVITVSQQLIVLEEASFRIADASDLIKRHMYHSDPFSQQLSQLVERLDEEDSSMHGVVADAFYMSFKTYKGRLFLLGFNDVSMGTLSNWADRLIALMEHGEFINAIQLATSYYHGDSSRAIIGLPESDNSRHAFVGEKLLELMVSSLRYAFGKNDEAQTGRADEAKLNDLAKACFSACQSLQALEFLFDDVYSWYSDANVQGLFLLVLEQYVLDGEMTIVPPIVLKDLVNYFVDRGLEARLEQALCHLNPETMDLDQISTLCKKYNLYDALFYVWSQALQDYTSVLKGLLDLWGNEQQNESEQPADVFKIFPYLSYTLTGRIYPTGDLRDDNRADAAKDEVYRFFFAGEGSEGAYGPNSKTTPSFANLQTILDYDASSFFSVLNEAFEESFLNGPAAANGESNRQDAGVHRKSQLSLNRQYLVSILLEIMVPPAYDAEEILYLNMFIARNLPKFPQFILLPGGVLQRILIQLCEFSNDDVAEDCQLSVEYLLSVYQPPDILSIIPTLTKARFHRVIKSIYRAEKRYGLLLESCFDDVENPNDIFTCIRQCLSTLKLDSRQIEDVRKVIIDRANLLLGAGTTATASTLEACAPDLHDTMLDYLDGDDHARYQYFRELLESSETSRKMRAINPLFVEQYVRLLCDFDPHHVSDYINKIQSTDIRLDEVLPALEQSGVIDALVVLLAREGKVREALDRLLQHLQTLQGAILGLVHSAEETPDRGNATEATDDLLESLQKYTRVGIWLCQKQTKAIRQTSRPNGSSRRASRRSLAPADLSPYELQWVDLIDTVVDVTRNISEATPTTDEADHGQDHDSIALLPALRSLIHTTFSALLTATTGTTPSSSPSATDLSPTPSFLPILHAFLTRASQRSPSLAHLRSVLSSIFAAYAYEESLLALAMRLLDKDLFVRVDDVARRRKRGWRPLGMGCATCGGRVWGGGAGSGVWNAWEKRAARHSGQDPSAPAESKSGKGKERADNGDGDGDAWGIGSGSNNAETAAHGDSADAQRRTGAQPSPGRRPMESEPVVVFSCRHVFHQRCLENDSRAAAAGLQGVSGKSADLNGPASSAFVCPLEAATAMTTTTMTATSVEQDVRSAGQ